MRLLRAPARLLVIATVAVCTACTPVWSQYGFDASHSGTQPNETQLSPSTAGHLQQLWSADTISGYNGRLSSPVASATTVFFVGRDYGSVGNRQGLYAFDRSSHALLWVGLTTSQPVTAPALDGNTVFVSAGGTLYAFPVNCGSQGATCAPLWTAPGMAHEGSSPAIDGGRLYISDPNGWLRVFDTDCVPSHGTCTPLWSWNIGEPATVAVSDGVVYIRGTQLYAVGGMT